MGRVGEEVYFIESDRDNISKLGELKIHTLSWWLGDSKIHCKIKFKLLDEKRRICPLHLIFPYAPPRPEWFTVVSPRNALPLAKNFLSQLPSPLPPIIHLPHLPHPHTQTLHGQTKLLINLRDGAPMSPTWGNLHWLDPRVNCLLLTPKTFPGWMLFCVKFFGSSH